MESLIGIAVARDLSHHWTPRLIDQFALRLYDRVRCRTECSRRFIGSEWLHLFPLGRIQCNCSRVLKVNETLLSAER